MLSCCINVVRKRGYKLEDDFIDDHYKPHASMISDIECEILQHGDKWMWKSVKAGEKKSQFNPKIIPQSLDHFLREDDTTNKNSVKAKGKESETNADIRAKERVLAKRLAHRLVVADSLTKMAPLTQSEVDSILSVLSTVNLAMNPLQRTIDGPISNNLWIVKPAGKSRGRGIATFNNIPKLLDYVDASAGGNVANWVVQKYMENPLTIAGRKFDVRQWVLVTDWNPLTIWFYNDNYVR